MVVVIGVRLWQFICEHGEGDVTQIPILPPNKIKGSANVAIDPLNEVIRFDGKVANISESWLRHLSDIQVTSTCGQSRISR